MKKTADEFLRELENHCAYRMDWLNDRGYSEKADAFQEVLYKIQQFKAEVNNEKSG